MSENLPINRRERAVGKEGLPERCPRDPRSGIGSLRQATSREQPAGNAPTPGSPPSLRDGACSTLRGAAQELECIEIHEDSEHRPTPHNGRAADLWTGSDVRTRALAYLARREYSRAELRGKLRAKSHDADQLDAVLDALEHDGFLSDARFAEHLVLQRAPRFGTRRIVAELKQHALDEAQLASLSTQLRDTERARARAVWEKKYGSAPKTHTERTRQMRFLAMRGFDSETITQLFRTSFINQGSMHENS